jgi:hypothetical protein
MLSQKSIISGTLAAFVAGAGIVFAQQVWSGGRAGNEMGSDTSDPRPMRPATPGFSPRSDGASQRSSRTGRLQSSWPSRPTDLSDRHGIVEWPVDAAFKKDLFTFCRIEYHSYRYSDSWLTDFPDSDLDFSFRLQQLTSLKVNPNPVRHKLTDKELFDYPFIYMLEVATLEFLDEEIEPLHRYLTNGGFLMVDDFWGDRAWESFRAQMERVLPGNKPVELELSHPIFHCVFDLKELPQVPGITTAIGLKGTGITTEVAPNGFDGDGKPHYWAYFDQKGRMMALVCHNTDLGDGWEREGEDKWYFEEFSMKRAYPMGVNIVFYAMTN